MIVLILIRGASAVTNPKVKVVGYWAQIQNPANLQLRAMDIQMVVLSNFRFSGLFGPDEQGISLGWAFTNMMLLDKIVSTDGWQIFGSLAKA